MCGICCVFYSETAGGTCNEKLLHERSRLKNRGPDRSSVQHVKLCDGSEAMFCGHVLHLRGAEITSQPAENSQGDLLLWNGEIFDGIDVGEDESDTQILLDLLSTDQPTDQQILFTMSQIKGPWSFIFWQAGTETLWFGRDVFGRRSLLWHLPDSTHPVMALTSVQIQPMTFREVPSIGLFKMIRCKQEGSPTYKIDVFPWRDAVWPGSMDLVVEDENFAERVSVGPSSAAVRVQVHTEEVIQSPMPCLNKALPPEDHSLLPLLPDRPHVDYLQSLLDNEGSWRVLAQQLIDVLLKAVKTRVFNQPRFFNQPQTGRSNDDVSRNTDKADISHQFENGHRYTQCSRQCVNETDLVSCDGDVGSRTMNECNDTGRTQGTNQNRGPTGCNGAINISRSHVIETLEAKCDHTPSDGRSCDDHLTETKSTKSDLISGDNGPCDDHVTSTAEVAILFSGGIDSTVIAALADRCVPEAEPIDLLNVAFEMKQKPIGKGKKKMETPEKVWDVPDRVTGYTALSELNPSRHWNFIEVNVTAAELQEARQAHIRELLHPLDTVLDDSIGCAVWFAARGCGVLGNGINKGSPITSRARVILCGMGADEQLAGYSRHRGRFQSEGWSGLISELELEVTRISARNLGRDDRIITDHGKESRFPFLDEGVVQFLSSLPVYEKTDLRLPRGLGEKLLLRLCATQLGLPLTAALPKRAIQFGSRIAKLENSKEKASDTCSRLTGSATGYDRPNDT